MTIFNPLQSKRVDASLFPYLQLVTLANKPALPHLLLGDDIWNNLQRLYITTGDYTVAGAGLPNMPEGKAHKLIYLYMYITNGGNNPTKSMGANNIVDIPTTWRNAKMLYRFNFERNHLTSAQQVSMVDGIEREILAGMGSEYVSASTATRTIDFNQTASGANDPLVQADLVALGWTVTDANTMTKVINGRTWRVQHNS